MTGQLAKSQMSVVNEDYTMVSASKESLGSYIVGVANLSIASNSKAIVKDAADDGLA